MLINSNTIINGKKCILISYQKEHVLKYHEWMKSEELQKLTSSEPLTLDEEYEMQKSWMVDNNKCTFIILDKEIYENTNNEIISMIGDTNLFLIESDNNEDNMYKSAAEIEIMIAEKSARGKGCGKEALNLMIIYGIKYLKIKSFFAKILINNNISIDLFKKFDFNEVDKSDVFQEVTLKKNVDENWIEWLNKQISYTVEIREN